MFHPPQNTDGLVDDHFVKSKPVGDELFLGRIVRRGFNNCVKVIIFPESEEDKRTRGQEECRGEVTD